MTVTVNGASRELAEGMTISDLLVELGLGSGWVVVEVNREVVDRGALSSRVLADCEVVEIVKAVAGG